MAFEEELDVLKAIYGEDVKIVLGSSRDASEQDSACANASIYVLPLILEVTLDQKSSIYFEIPGNLRFRHFSLLLDEEQSYCFMVHIASPPPEGNVT